jgi:hypothetical protein
MFDDDNYPSSSEEVKKKQSPDTTASELANHGGNPLHNPASGNAPMPDTPYDEMDNFDAVTDLVGEDDVNRAVDDLMSSYADFPNLLTEDDLVASSYPVIKFDEQIPEYQSPDMSSNCFRCPQDFSE